MSGLGIDFQEIILHIINVVVLFIVLRIFLYKPVSRFMKRRSDGIAQQIDDAAKKQAEAEQLRARYDEMIKNAQGLAGELIAKSKETADEQARQIIEEAEKNAGLILEKSKSDIAYLQAQAKENMRDEITQMAIDIAERVLRREITAEDNMETINRFFEENAEASK